MSITPLTVLHTVKSTDRHINISFPFRRAD
jgi:hypothetical protein